MGEVYRAKDTRLDRVVAIKVLLNDHPNQEELRGRFEREGRTVAALNHPHICVLHDIGHQNGYDFLVMEFLEGETLAHRLQKGPLPLAQVLQYGIEIADALDRAHRSGVTHRDLKPANVMLTKSGAKLLDFGLATLRRVDVASGPLSELPTASQDITAQGAIIGTLQYMAPEQLEGKETDGRTDIFALGAVLYEMVTGKRIFDGKSQASIITAIMSFDPPPMSSFEPMSPPALDRVVRRCLSKDPDRRWQTAADLREELQWIAEAGDAKNAMAVAAAKPASPKRLRPVALGLVWMATIALVAALVWYLKPSAPASAGVSRTMVPLPADEELAALNQVALALSPDGGRLAYVAIRGDVQQIYLRSMDSLDPSPLPGTEGAAAPFFSPDGRWIGFFADGKLKKISVNGDAAIVLADAATPRGAVWGTGGTIVFAPLSAGVLYQVPDSGGEPKPLTRYERGENTHRLPDFLPGARAVVFAAGTGTRLRIASYSFDSGEQRELIPSGTQPRYVPSGHLTYVQSGTLMAVPFDPDRLEVTGAAVPVVPDVLQTTPTAGAQYTVSARGSLAYVAGGQTSRRSLHWISRDGTARPLAAPPRAYQSPRISPDGGRIAVSVDAPEPQVWIYDIARETLTRLTFDGTYNRSPIWSPDGKRLALISNRDAAQNTYWQLADGGGSVERLTTTTDITAPSSFSPNGQDLALTVINPTTQRDIGILRVNDRQLQMFRRTNFNEASARFSPDGRWLAYSSDESGRREIYVQSYPGPGGRWQISTDGGTEPVWNPQGRELFYRNGDSLWSVLVVPEPNFSVSRPRVVFRGPYMMAPGNDSAPDYDVSPGGQRFLMLKEEEVTGSVTQVIVVQNWLEELARGVTSGRR
jgi:serine/threonine-protein kinase